MVEESLLSIIVTIHVTSKDVDSRSPVSGRTLSLCGQIASGVEHDPLSRCCRSAAVLFWLVSTIHCCARTTCDWPSLHASQADLLDQ